MFHHPGVKYHLPWPNLLGRGGYLVGICKITEFERRQSWHSNAAPITSSRDTQQPLLTFFHFLMKDREKASPPKPGFSIIIFTSPITTCLGTSHPWSQVNRRQAGGPWPGVSFPSIAEQQTQVKCDPEPEHKEMF